MPSSGPAARVTLVDVVAALTSWALGQRMSTLGELPPASLAAVRPVSRLAAVPAPLALLE